MLECRMLRMRVLLSAPVILLIALISACEAGEEPAPESSEDAAPEMSEEPAEPMEEPDEEEDKAGESEGRVEARTGDTVKVHYTGTLQDGTEFDTSRDGEPLEFTIGSGQLIPGFEHPVIGMKVGQWTTVTVSPENGYGPRREELVFTVGRDELSSESEPYVGQVYTRQGPEGPVRARVVEVSEDTVTLDANHPLAGKTLTFEIELVEIVENAKSTGE